LRRGWWYDSRIWPDLLRADVDLIAMIVRLRGAHPATNKADDDGEPISDSLPD
jgi:hypothetical protein